MFMVQASLGRQLTPAEAAGQTGLTSVQELDRCLQQGKAAHEVLYQRNLGLVHRQAFQYYTNSDKLVSHGDLIQVWSHFPFHQFHLFSAEGSGVITDQHPGVQE